MSLLLPGGCIFVPYLFSRRPPPLPKAGNQNKHGSRLRHPKPAFCRAKALLNGDAGPSPDSILPFRPSSVKGRFGLDPISSSSLPDGKMESRPGRGRPLFGRRGSLRFPPINKMAPGPHNQDARLTPVHLLLQSSHFPEGDPEFLRQLHRCGAPHLLDQIVEGDPE